MESISWVTYQYQLLRYRHDHLGGEFVNLGIVYFDANAGILLWRFEDKKYGRISQFFGESVQGNILLSALKQLDKKLGQLATEQLNRFGSVEALTTELLPPDDSSLFFSESWKGRHTSHDDAFEVLYNRIVGRYQEESINRHDDAYAWSHVYRKYMDKYQLTGKLQSHKVKTQDDAINFDHSCKNGVWHCLHSLSFDLKNETNIKDKIYKWDGIARELLTSKEPIKVYLLSILPDNKDLVQLLQNKLNVQDSNVEVRVVTEGEADTFARELKKALEAAH